jgi:hypothetical protein
MKKITLLMAAFLMAVGMNAQIFEDDFELDSDGSTSFFNWDNFDDDGDGNFWNVVNIDGTGWTSLFEGNVANSDSWSPSLGGVTPDNYLITSDPLTLGTNSEVSFLMGSFQTNGTFLGDRLAVYLSPTNDPAQISGLTAIFDQTVGDVCACDSTANNAVQIDIDASAFDGQTVYLVMRHFDTFDENSVLIDNVVVDGTLSITDNAINGFNYFYSPQSQNLTINASEAFSNISIFNVLGQQVIDKNLSSTSEVINLSSLKNGVYIANATSNGQKATFKLIKR